MKKSFPYVLAFLLAIFGLLTLFLSTSIIFDLFDIRIREGHYVLFVVVANFISSLLYLLAAYGFLRKRKWTLNLLATSATVLCVAFFTLLVYIYAGGLYETKTIGAMIFRIALTLGFAGASYLLINKKLQNEN
ncbi:MAG: hypothetical protein WC341_06620 [Bacteroidales bacterium]